MRRLLYLLSLVALTASAQHLDSLHVKVDAAAPAATPYVYASFQEASRHLVDGITVYFAPGVYWIDDPDSPDVREGENGREPFGMVVSCPHLKLVGLGREPHEVVLASQRGQMQGAVGNFTMFDFWCSRLEVENLTMGNFCNVDLVYPADERLNRPKRSEAITQAHVGYVHGDSLTARRVRFISRLNLNPLNGAACSYYEDCHFECTDDALNGQAVYRRCDFDFYGQKPFWSTFGRGVLFVDCDFYVKGPSREMYFCKQGGPVAVVNSRYHAPDSIYVGWTAYPQPWLRCYQQGFTLNGRPYVIGQRQPQNTVILAGFNGTEPPFVGLSAHEAVLQTGRDSLLLSATEPVQWQVEAGAEAYVSVVSESEESVRLIPVNNTDETASFCIAAITDDGRQAACQLTVRPRQLPPPLLTHQPQLRLENGAAVLDYELVLQGRRDESAITWLRDGIPVAVSRGEPLRQYRLGAADVGHFIAAILRPRHHQSPYGDEVQVALSDIVKASEVRLGETLDTDFHDFPCQWQPQVMAGYWTVDGHKPVDTEDFEWAFNPQKPMWEYGEGFNGAVGKGLLQAQRGARLMYTPVEDAYGDMHLTLLVDPTKTAGQGFGSATGQYMDVCLKFDPHTLTGYGLRIIRTVKHAKAVDFLLVRYDRGVVTPLTEPVSSTCYRTGCTISLHFIGHQLTAAVSTATPPPADSQLPHEVSLSAEVAPSPYGGVHIQHTGSCGESTTMLHRLKVEWGR